MFNGALFFGKLFNGRLLNSEQQSATVAPVQYLDGAGVGVGNRSWMKELLVDHRVRHTGTARSAQAGAQTAAARGSSRAAMYRAAQPAQSAAAQGYNYDVELENFAMLAAAVLDEELEDEQWAA